MSSQLDLGAARALRLCHDSIAALQSGRDDAPVVLFVPGFTGSKEDFAPLIDPIAAAGIGVLAVVVVVPWSKAWRTWNRHGFRGATSRHNLGELDGRYHGRESHGIHSRYRYKEWHDIRGEQRGKKRA